MSHFPFVCSYLKKHCFIAFFILCFPVLIFSQQVINVNVSWKDYQKTTVFGISVEAPTTNSGEFTDLFPVFSTKEKFLKGNFSVQVGNIVTELPSDKDKKYFDLLKLSLPKVPEIQAKVTLEKNQSFILSSCQPFYLSNGQLVKIKSYSLTVQPQSATTPDYVKSYASNSVLSNGKWYKISVPDDGVYKMDKKFFLTMGIDTALLKPDFINLYGNSDGILSESNSGAYKDDLKKCAIWFVGNNDTVFDANEYFVFYGAGPNRWDRVSGEDYKRAMHIYSSVNHYFVRVDASEPPLRMQTLNSSALPSNQTITSYTYFDIHENEYKNLVKGGQRWYGEAFDATLSQDFSFNVPNIVTSTPVRVNYAVASNVNALGNSFVVTYAGTQINSFPLASVGEDYARNETNFSFSPSSSNLKLNYTFIRTSPAFSAYLDYISIACRRGLSMTGSLMKFRDVPSFGVGNVGLFEVLNMNTNIVVADISDKSNVRFIQGTLANGKFSFVQPIDTLREFVAFDTTKLLKPTFVQEIENQNLHALSAYDYIIVSPKQFLSQAQRLGALHSNNGLNTYVADIEQVYNEFSSGNQDATAIRRFVKMFYDRAGGNAALQPKHLCLFGDATYDPKNRVSGNNYMIPTYEFINSENHISALVSDDYFGLLDDTESIGDLDMMDIGVGRLLISTSTHATTQVDKIEHYMKNGYNSPIQVDQDNACCMDEYANTFGDWRQVYTTITDDEEGGIFISSDAEPAFNQVQAFNNSMNCTKIYSDAYKQISTAGGHRYPDVNAAITDRIERGSLITNYIGHGGEVGAAEERIITIPESNEWKNVNRMGLFVSATCEFTKFDDPSRESIGELISLNPKGGSIALMTTTRSVYISINTTVIQSFYSHVLQRDANNDALTFGEIIRRTKNTSGSNQNRRCFNLIGDPALKIALPKWKLIIDSINHISVNSGVDTVRALTKMVVSGHVEDFSATKLSSYNGVVTPTVFDKAKTQFTLGNDPMSPIIPFKTQKSALFRGRATVKNGDFKFEFIVPKDIDFSYGRGKISLYATDNNVDAGGWDSTFVIGGINPNPIVDNTGPDLKIYLNDDSFVNGSISSANPLLVVEAFDENGINTAGNGIGHDIVAVLDGDAGKPIVLNEYYKANLDSYQSGKVQYTLRNLAPGPHTLDVKLWDVNNNSSSIRLDFTVVVSEDLTLDHVYNYPNPFTTRTLFMFEHNQSCSHLETQVQIYTISGRLVKTINKLVATNGFRVEGIEWDGKDDYGDQLAKGVYVYKVSVTLPDGKKANKIEKLVLLK